MPCCKAEEFRLCKDEPTVDYTDEDGREYCVFHAPQGSKGITLREFNGLIFTAINSTRETKETCNLSGTIFEGDISFSQYGKDNPMPSVSFSDATFSGAAEFSRVHFADYVDFRNVHFSGKSIFDKTQFRKNAFFDNAKFKEDTFFNDAGFDQIVEFNKTQFSKDAYFSGTQFLAKASFLYSIFNGMANFHITQFHGRTEFVNAQFNRGAKFFLTEFEGLVYFSGAHFNGEVYFHESIFFHCADLQRLIINNKIHIEAVDLSKTSFLGTDLRKIDFINCTWNKEIKSKVLYDENMLTEKNNKISSNKEDCRKVATLYRMLKQKSKEDHNESEVSEWHYREKEVQRKGRLLNNRFMLILSYLYWLSSGYGERAGKAALILLIIIVLLSLSFVLSGLTPVDEAGIHGITSIKGLTGLCNFNNLWMLPVNTFQYALFRAPYFKPASIFGEYLKLFTQIVVPIQIALFALAVRNRFRR